MDFEYTNSEVNPQFANIVTPTEVMIVSTFHLELEGGGGDIQFSLPYSMLEPIRELLDASLRSEIKTAEVDVKTVLLEQELRLKDILKFKKGDILPIELPEKVLVSSGEVAMFKGMLGTSNGHYAIKLEEKIERDETKSTVKEELE